MAVNVWILIAMLVASSSTGMAMLLPITAVAVDDTKWDLPSDEAIWSRKLGPKFIQQVEAGSAEGVEMLLQVSAMSEADGPTIRSYAK